MPMPAPWQQPPGGAYVDGLLRRWQLTDALAPVVFIVLVFQSLLDNGNVKEKEREL